MDPLTIVLLVLAAFVAAFIDSNVGGGGVISLPALLAAGLPPHLALGTNKLAATGASFMATIQYTRRGYVVLPLALALIPLAVVGSMAGAATVLVLDARFVKGLVLVVMAAMTLYVVARKHFGLHHRYPGIQPATFLAAALLAVVVGFYDGFLGPGTGSFLIFGFVGILAMDFVHAAAHSRVLNLASNAAALAYFALADQVVYDVGLPMMAAMLVGGYAGSHFGMKHGARWIKPLFVSITLVLMVRLVLTL